MIKALIGLGNPGKQYDYTRHNIGFMILDALADAHGASWRTKDNYEVATIMLADKPVLLIKPQTFMNNSGAIATHLKKNGLQLDEILVVHDELELPFGKIAVKNGGSAKGHNGLRSLIELWGADFKRLRVGIGRPEEKHMVGTFVLQKFSEGSAAVEKMVQDAVGFIEKVVTE